MCRLATTEPKRLSPCGGVFVAADAGGILESTNSGHGPGRWRG